MQEMPLISVIIPVYNVEKYIDRCVSSVFAQTYTNLEIILVDDGSQDKCPKICDEYAKIDNRIIVIHQENSGLSSARNAGINIANGEYLYFVDSDDWIQENAIEILLNVSREYNAEIVQGKGKVFKNDGGEETCSQSDVGEVKCYSNLEAVRNLIGMSSGNSEFRIVAFGKLIHRSLFEELRFPVGKIHEDEYLIPKLAYIANSYAIVDSYIYYYRLSENSIMRKEFSNKRLDAVFVWRERLNWLKTNGLIHEYKWFTSAYYFNLIGIYTNVVKHNLDNKEAVKKELKNEINSVYKLVIKNSSLKRIIIATIYRAKLLL